MLKSFKTGNNFSCTHFINYLLHRESKIVNMIKKGSLIFIFCFFFACPLSLLNIPLSQFSGKQINDANNAHGSNPSLPEVGIYKRKQESKKIRTRPSDQENKNSTKKAIKKTRTRPRKRPRRKKFFFDHFLGRVLVFLFSYFLTFLLSFINSRLRKI